MSDIIREIEAAQLKQEVDQFNVGDTVKVYGRIKEGNRERIQVFEGIVLKRQGGSSRETFTVRKTSNGIGVEKTWPLHSPNVEKIEVVRRGKVRRAKLNYLRSRVGNREKVTEAVKKEERSANRGVVVLFMLKKAVYDGRLFPVRGGLWASGVIWRKIRDSVFTGERKERSVQPM